MKDRFENCHKVLNELSEMVFPQSVNCECCGKEIMEKDAATYYEGENFQILCSECYDKKTEEKIAELKAENERLYEEKNCLHKIIDRLLENAGYSKDIASAEDFEEVYENMQYNKQKLLELQKILQEIKAIAERELSLTEKGNELYEVFSEIIQKITKTEEE